MPAHSSLKTVSRTATPTQRCKGQGQHTASLPASLPCFLRFSLGFGCETPIQLSVPHFPELSNPRGNRKGLHCKFLTLQMPFTAAPGDLTRNCRGRERQRGLKTQQEKKIKSLPVHRSSMGPADRPRSPFCVFLVLLSSPSQLRITASIANLLKNWNKLYR